MEIVSGRERNRPAPNSGGSALQETSVARSLSFLREHTGEDELTLIGRALDLGLYELTVQVAEQAFVDGDMARDEAAQVLGAERVRDLEYAKQALAQDVKRGLEL
jgi:hypothetical protein